jgi:hypothetical protein
VDFIFNENLTTLFHMNKLEEETSFEASELEDENKSIKITNYPYNNVIHKFKTNRILHFIVVSLSILTIFTMSYRYTKEQLKSFRYPSISLSQLCNSTVWQKNLLLNCTNIEGKVARPLGTSNARNMIVTCLRWAIDGGMGFVVPRIGVRNKENISIFDEWDNMSFLFDESNLRNTLRDHCPQLQVYDTNYKIDQDNVIMIERPPPPPWSYYTHGEYRNYITNLLHTNNIKNTNINPTVVWDTEVLFGWDFEYDSAPVHYTLMTAVKFSHRLLTIGSVIAELIKDSFIGFHLRCESDWEATDYKSEIQAFHEFRKGYLDITTIYLAVGSEEIRQRFADDMKELNLFVVDKWSLVYNRPDLFEEMSSLNFDQLAVIDHQVLVKSTHFIGTGLSSFSYAIAWDRGNGNIEDCNCHLADVINPPFICCY